MGNVLQDRAGLSIACVRHRVTFLACQVVKAFPMQLSHQPAWTSARIAKGATVIAG
jgi:hypothetical protein